MKACHCSKAKREGLANGDVTITLGGGIRPKAASNARLVPTKNPKLSLSFGMCAPFGEGWTS